MPSPIGHALGGLIVGLLGTLRRPEGLRPEPDGRTHPGTSTLAPRHLGTLAPRHLGTLAPRHLGTLALMGVLPDLDFLWGRHNMETHSLGAAVLAGIVVWLATGRRDRRLAMLCTLAWSTHVLFDWLGSDDTPPLGVMALWPLSTEFYFAHAYVFEAISRRYWLPNFIPHNTWAVVKEVLMLGPPLAAIWAWGRRRASPRLPR